MPNKSVFPADRPLPLLTRNYQGKYFVHDIWRMPKLHAFMFCVGVGFLTVCEIWKSKNQQPPIDEEQDKVLEKHFRKRFAS